jgi:hypothetical protein
MKKLFVFVVAVLFTTASFATSQPVEVNPQYAQIAKIAKEGNFVAKEVKVKEVRMDFCIYEVSYEYWNEFGEVISEGGYTITAPCPGQGFPVCLPIGNGWTICL